MPRLPVPYYTQPTGTTCQATCLKMVAQYLDKVTGVPPQPRDPEEIKKIINGDSNRPEKRYRNHYENMKWWFEQRYSSDFAFHREQTLDEARATEIVVRVIDDGFPLLVSTNHANVEGHVIVVIGYEAAASGAPEDVAHLAGGVGTTSFVCHDPYGAFDPSLGSKLWGKRRFDFGYSQPDGVGESGAGAAVQLDAAGIRRIRNDQHSPNMFYFLYPSRNFSPMDGGGISIPS